MKPVLVIAALLGLLLLALSAGRLWLSPDQLLMSLRAGPEEDVLLWHLRMPRALAGLFIGAGLGLAGAVFQSLLRNSLASPDIIGVSQGAALGGVTAQLAGAVTMLGALSGGVLATALIFSLSLSRRAGLDPRRLILYGIGVGITCSAALSILLIQAGDAAAGQAMAWLAGSLNAMGWQEVQIAALALAVGALILLPAAHALDRLEFGDDPARGWGLAIHRLRPLLLFSAALLVSAMVALAGTFSFVAFVSGPLARRIGRGQVNLVAAAAFGAGLVTLADTATRVFAPSALIPAGIYTSLIGAPVLVLILHQKVIRDQI